MAFEEELMKLAALVKKHKPDVKNEAQTKQSLVIPFISILGWDVANPCEVEPEYATLSMGSRGRPFSVDYALKINKIPVIFIEVKNIDDDLTARSNQLESYFNITATVKLAILTNGLIYRFFTEGKQNNIMDSEPFFEFNIENYDQYSGVHILENFQKGVFNPPEVARYARELILFLKIRSEVREILFDQPDYFIRMLDKQLRMKHGNITKKKPGQLRSLVKQCIYSVLPELNNQDIRGIKIAPGKTVGTLGKETKSRVESRKSSMKKESTATEEELRAFQIIKELVSEGIRDPKILSYTDAKMYFSIYLESPMSWFVRLYLGAREKYVITKLSLEEVKELAPGHLTDSYSIKGKQRGRIHISTIDDLYDLRDVLHRSIKALNAVDKGGLTADEEKIRAFEIIRETLSGAVNDLKLISYDDKTNYFSVYFRTRFNWIARLFFGPRARSIVMRISKDEASRLGINGPIKEFVLKDKSYARVGIGKLEELKQFKEALVQSLSKAKDAYHSKAS
jgi:hypothetical protein